jgi:hypothetical protein
MHCFGIKTETTIDHHAYALGLFNPRNRSLSFALGNIIEDADTVLPTTRDVLRAVYVLETNPKSNPRSPITCHRHNQSLVLAGFLAARPGRKTTQHKKLERAHPSHIPGRVARALALSGGEIAARFTSSPYLLFE